MDSNNQINKKNPMTPPGAYGFASTARAPHSQDIYFDNRAQNSNDLRDSFRHTTPQETGNRKSFMTSLHEQHKQGNQHPDQNFNIYQYDHSSYNTSAGAPLFFGQDIRDGSSAGQFRNQGHDQANGNVQTRFGHNQRFNDSLDGLDEYQNGSLRSNNMGPRYKTSGSFDAYLPGQNVSPYLSQHSQAQQHDYSHDAFVQPQQGGQDDPFRTRDPLQQPRNSLAYPHSEYRMRSIQGQDIKNGSGDNALDRRNIGTVCEEDHRYRVTNYQPDDNDKDAVGEAQVEDGRQDLYQHANRATANSSPVKSIYQSNTRYDVPHYRPLLTSPVDYQNAANKRIEQEVTAVMAADGYINTSPCPEDMPRLAALVFDAITCTDPTVIEDKRNKNGKDAQAVVRLKTGFYEPAQATQTASMGVSLIEPHHKGKFEGTDVHQTFFDRLDAIIVTLACSKAACKQILDAAFLNRLVNAPHSELKLKMGNSIINGRRNVQNSTGRAVKALWGDDEAIARLIRTKQEDAEKEAKLKRDPDFETGATVKPSAGAGAAFKTPSRSNKRGMTGGAGSAAKRHSASSKRLLKLKQEHVNEDEAEEDYEFETPSMPSRRPVIAGRSQAARNDRILSMTSNTTIDPQLNASPRSLDTRPSPASAPAGDLNLSYRLHLCNFLGVGSSHAYQLSLEELRLYAFAYNSDTLSQAWYHHSFTHGESGHGNRIEFFTKNGTAQLMPMAQFSQLGHLSALALERGDIDTGGVVINEVVDSHRFESRNLDVLTRQTMGLVQNPFGFFNSSPPPQANTGASASFHTPPTS